ncbi:MAG TPA: peptide MFS transporter [Chitinophagaceae bacterium]|nr:peptide MFS transporter [Chitinophagaceae bacterium]HNA96084.1 peptide MFS transporter [Chitinophagaceae bacterium]HND95575.1 peptide MFS transporter [Chitinophagaceae bacterium]HNF46331.1 peptide MFS transporter [Chitinophagaceae bacterium]HNJ26191.1 peptide MFS transporter [Chitinophagaceae bacterium]
MWKKHPKALPFLFFSEMWERFGYYLMIGIFTLYLKDSVAGFNMDEKESASLYGTFIALVFFTPFLGGLIADRYLGYRRSIILGGLLMGIGYCMMGIHSKSILYLSMTLVIIGNGFFKPNISTLLGNVYSTPQHSHQKDEGYNIFYMGINVGAFVCNFFGAALYSLMGWGAAFAAAGVGMFIGVITFISGTRHYKEFDIRKPLQPGDLPLWKIIALVIVPSLIFGAIGFYLKGVGTPNSFIFDSDSTDAFIFACIPVLAFYTILLIRSNKDERPAMGAMLSIFAVVILFWAIFKQNGSALNTWASRYTDREVSGVTGDILHTLKQTDKPANTTYKLDSVVKTDHQFRKVKVNGQEVKELGYPSYFKNVAPDKLPKEGETVKAWLPSLSQSINPFWVIVLTPLIVAFFTWLRRKGKEPSTPSKIAFGLLISALSVLVMIAAVKAGNNGTEKVSVWWLIGSYGVITIGELFLSPMGLSLVSKLSPVRITSLMMGGWFLSTSIGNKLSGILASKWDEYENKADYFWLNFILLGVAALFLFVLLKWLNKVMKAKGVN